MRNGIVSILRESLVNVFYTRIEHHFVIRVGSNEIGSTVQCAILRAHFLVDGAMNLIVEYGIFRAENKGKRGNIFLFHVVNVIDKIIYHITDLQVGHRQFSTFFLAFLAFFHILIVAAVYLFLLPARLNHFHTEHRSMVVATQTAIDGAVKLAVIKG